MCGLDGLDGWVKRKKERKKERKMEDFVQRIKWSSMTCVCETSRVIFRLIFSSL